MSGAAMRTPLPLTGLGDGAMAMRCAAGSGKAGTRVVGDRGGSGGIAVLGAMAAAIAKPEAACPSDADGARVGSATSAAGLLGADAETVESCAGAIAPRVAPDRTSVVFDAGLRTAARSAAGFASLRATGGAGRFDSASSGTLGGSAARDVGCCGAAACLAGSRSAESGPSSQRSHSCADAGGACDTQANAISTNPAPDRLAVIAIPRPVAHLRNAEGRVDRTGTAEGTIQPAPAATQSAELINAPAVAAPARCGRHCARAA